MCRHIQTNTFLSAQKVPNGIIDASKAKAIVRNFQSLAIPTCKTSKTYNTNKKPCAIPKIWFGIGIAAKYFSGIVTKSKTKKDTPSKKATRRNRPKEVFSNSIFLSVGDFSRLIFIKKSETGD
jgi:hypothetical protein